MNTSLCSIAAGTAFLLSSLAAPVRADILYVSDYGFAAIQKIPSDGNAGHPPWFVGGLDNPEGLAFDSSGILYVALPASHTIEKFSQTGADLGLFASTGSSGAGGLAFDRAGNLYAALGNNTIEKFTPDGNGSVFADASDGLNAPGSLAFDSAENLYVANFPVALAGRRVIKFTPDGVGSVFADASDGLFGPEGLAVDRADNLYVLDGPLTASIYKFTPDGVGSLFAEAGGEHPWGLAFDSAGNLYYTSPYPVHIGKISPDGVPLSDFNPQPVSFSTYLAFTDDFGVPVPLANQGPIPEPATWALLGLPVLGLLASRRRR